jgi:hypothetical protein
MIPLLAIAVAAADTAERLQEAITAHVAQALAVPSADVEIVHLGASWESCADPQREELRIEARYGEDYLGPTDLRVTALSGGEVCGSYRIKPKIARWVSLPVAAEAAAPGEVIKLTTQRTRLESSGATPVRPEAGPYIALTAIRVGEPITTTRARSQPDVGGGAPVQVEIRSGGLTIRCDGVLIGNADIGAPARARCNTTGTVVSGTLTSTTRFVSAGG